MLIGEIFYDFVSADNPGILMLMLGQLNAVTKFQNDTSNKNERSISKAKFLLQESIEQPVNLEDIAKELPMGYSSFPKVLKQIIRYCLSSITGDSAGKG
jgi:hypothetical protein